jgi:para-aminobenzoate synthetase component 1
LSIQGRSALIEEFPTPLSTLELFEYFRGEPYAFFLDSAMDPAKLGRFSLMGSEPFLVLKSRGRQISLIQNGSETALEGNPLEELGRLLETYRLEKSDLPAPGSGAAVGYLSYDLCHFVEKLPTRAIDDLNLPECFFGFYDRLLVRDNLLGHTYLVSSGFPEQDDKGRILRANQRLEELKTRLKNKVRLSPAPGRLPSSRGASKLKSNFSHSAYVKAVGRARQYIIDGDIFEVNLSQRFESDVRVTPYELYLKLREINPAPFAAFLDFGEPAIISASPERYLKLSGDRVETRPIKGTIRRGQTPAEDQARAQQLLNSVKDRAENMMIVDLERNDLGRVCRFGSVKVTELAILETYPTLFHLTSTVVGQLREGVSRIDLLKAAFPGGSITGAPKVRSMEIIDELEPTRRSVYTGSLGYLSFDGDLDLNIVIRTFILKGPRAYFQAGGAVVYDSVPESEYQETLDKVRALMEALNQRPSA